MLQPITKELKRQKGNFDFVISRAVTRMKAFIHWVVEKVHSDKAEDNSGIIALKGGDLEEEMSEIKKNVSGSFGF